MNRTNNPCKCCPNGRHITQPGTKRHETSPHAGKGFKWIGKKRVPLTRQDEIAMMLRGDA